MILIATLCFSLMATDIISNFVGYTEDSRIVLQWNSGNENDVIGYEIHRSVDGHNFYQIGFLQSQGNNSSYTYIDNSVFAKVSGRTYHYKIGIKDINGNISFIDTIEVLSNISDVSHTWGSIKAIFK